MYLKPAEKTEVTREMGISDEAVMAPVLAPYSAEAVKEATTNGRALIFFHAPWCPFCRAAEADIIANFDQIPPDLTIIKADYDSEKELKKRYNVTTQHTFVQVDAEGNEVTKWVGAETLEDILSRIAL